MSDKNERKIKLLEEVRGEVMSEINKNNAELDKLRHSEELFFEKVMELEINFKNIKVIDKKLHSLRYA
ncbi:MAG: hypothetical protein HOP21_10670 [Methylotenera sp.]|nr:hypothetical protein [Methylotenera sp.]